MADAVFTVDARDFAGLRAHLANGDFAIIPARRFINDSTMKLWREIALRTPVDTGRLRSSIGPRFMDDGLTGEVGTNVKYAPHVEFGTRPHWPPLSAMQPWASRHGFPKGKQGAFMVARSISRKGTPPRRMFQAGLAASKPYIDSRAAQALDEMEKLWRS